MHLRYTLPLCNHSLSSLLSPRPSWAVPGAPPSGLRNTSSSHPRLVWTFCWQLVAACCLGGVQIYVGETTCHITKELIYTRYQCDGVYVALQLAKHGAWEWNLLLMGTLFLC